MNINPIKFAKSLYYANTSKVSKKIQPPPYPAEYFMKNTTPKASINLRSIIDKVAQFFAK